MSASCPNRAVGPGHSGQSGVHKRPFAPESTAFPIEALHSSPESRILTLPQGQQELKGA